MSATRPALEASREQDADIIEVSGVDDDAAMEPGHRLGWTARGGDCTLVVQEVTAIRDIHGEGAVQHVGKTMVLTSVVGCRPTAEPATPDIDSPGT